MFLPMLRMWQSTLDCDLPGSPETLRLPPAGFAFMAWSTNPRFEIYLRLPWLSISFQPVWNFLNNQVTLLWSSAHSPLANNCFWLFPGCNSPVHLWHYEGDLFVCFGAKPNKGLSSRSRRDRSGQGNVREGAGKRNPGKAVGEGWRRRAVDNSL